MQEDAECSGILFHFISFYFILFHFILFCSSSLLLTSPLSFFSPFSYEHSKIDEPALDVWNVTDGKGIGPTISRPTAGGYYECLP